MTWQERVLALIERSRFSSIAEVAGAAGISQGSLNMAMNGKHTPRTTTMDKVAKVLGTTSQYILYGEQKAPSQTVPLLNASSIGLWMMKQLSLEDCSIITSPGDLSDSGFAWICEVVDMAPTFPPGSIVFFEPVMQTDLNPNDRSYIIAAMVHKGHGGSSVKKHLMETQGLINQAEKILNITNPIFREVVKSGNGLYLSPVDGDFEKIPLEPMDIIARAKYCLTTV